MNKDQIKGRIKEAEGKLRKDIGHATGNPEAEAEGAVQEAQGNAQKNFGDLRRKIAKVIDK